MLNTSTRSSLSIEYACFAKLKTTGDENCLLEIKTEPEPRVEPHARSEKIVIWWAQGVRLGWSSELRQRNCEPWQRTLDHLSLVTTNALTQVVTCDQINVLKNANDSIRSASDPPLVVLTGQEKVTPTVGWPYLCPAHHLHHGQCSQND